MCDTIKVFNALNDILRDCLSSSSSKCEMKITAEMPNVMEWIICSYFGTLRLSVFKFQSVNGKVKKIRKEKRENEKKKIVLYK